jgi:hypothetical protein
MNAALSPKPLPGHAPLEGEPDGANRRRHDRLDYRTAVVAIVSEPTGFRCIRCQTNDVSFEGARVVCFEPIPTTSVYLRILMPGLSEKFVEAEIVNQRVQSDLRIGAGRVSRHIYGVRFLRLVSDAAMLDQLQVAAAARPSSARA